MLLHETHLAPVVEVQICAAVGSADERPAEAGLAHFHEHMLFKGTERRGVGEVAGDVEGAGGRINAYTSFDLTVYHATLPSDRLAVGLDVLADAVIHSAFDPDEIAREQEVVLEEIRRSEDSPLQVLGNALFAEAYRTHPYRAPILGSAESVARFDRARVRAFFERWYTPEHLVVIAAGDLEVPRFLEEVRAVFGGLVAGGARRERPAEPAQDGLRSVVCPRPFERTHLQLAWPAVGLGHRDCAYLDLLAFALGNCESSRLVRRVRERDGLVERIDAGSYTPLDPGVCLITAETDAGRAPAAIEAAVREVERVRAEPVSEEELETARANFLASEHFERESVAGLAHKLTSFHVLAGDRTAEQRYLAAVRAARAEDLQRVAREYLAPERLTVGAVLPEADAPALDHAAIEAAVARGVEQTARASAVPVRQAIPAAKRARARRGKAGAGPELVSFQLDGGGALHVLPRHEIPVVAARAAFLGGLLAEDAHSSGLSSFLASMWLRGTRNRSAAGFARDSERLAAEIDGFTGRSSLGVTLETPSERLDEALDLFAEVLLEPAFDPEELERERRETLAAIERREDQLGQRVFLLFSETHYRSHPYRMPMAGTQESVSGFDTESVAAHHARLIRAPNLVLAVAGDVEPDALAKRLSTRLAGLERGPFEPPAPAVEDPPREIRRAELRKDRAQAHLVIGFRGITVADEDRFALEVITQLLSGQGGRLFLELRDRRGLAYAVHAGNLEGLAPGHFTVYIATAPEKLDEARAGLLEELARVRETPPAEAELERARRYLIGNFVIDQQRSAVRAAHVALDSLYGLGPDSARRYPEQIAAVTRDDVLRAARRIIKLDAYTEAVIRP